MSMFSRGWAGLKNWFKNLWKDEEQARRNAPETSNDSPLTGVGRNTPADWAAKRRQTSDLARRQKELDQTRQRLAEELQEKIEREENERLKSNATASPSVVGAGSVAPLPGRENYGGDVPSRAQWREESALWIASGKFHLVQNSDNVYAIAYDVLKSSLYVQYKHWAPPMKFGAQNGPGPIYEYKNVSVAEAHALYRAKDTGQWLWDNVRIRGTWSGHRKPYRLVAISQRYMPRQAMWLKNREWFIRRQAWGTGGQVIYSQLPNAPAPPMGMDGKPVRGHYGPDRGTPNRGTPFRGR